MMTNQNSRTHLSLSLSSFSTKLLSTTALTAASLAALALPASAQTIPDNALPQGEVVTHGSADYDRSTQNVLKITQNSGVTSANYFGGFNIGKDAAVLMVQKSSDKFIHIDKSDKVSIINGLFSGNGTNFILNRDGVLIGESAVIDMGGFVAATGELGAGTDLAAGKIEINNFGGGAIDVKGGASITVAEAGIAAFVSPTIRNDGVINARLGKVAFAAGDKVTLDLYGDKLVEIAVSDKLADAIIEHTGEIHAEGGTVQMTASAAKEAVDNIINVKGLVTVASATQVGGKIILSGGDRGKVSVSGTLDATGVSGGDIEVTGQFVSAEGNAVLDASGDNGGGNIKFGGAWQGGGDTPTSDYAYVGQNAILRANAEEDGDGGEVVVWSDKGTGVYGSIEAKGGANSGNGGNVEVSSLGFYDYRGSVNTSAANGLTGNFLLDPLDILIRGGTGDGDDIDSANANNLGSTSDSANGLIAYATTNLEPFLITEQEIEQESALNNIIIQARRSITTQAGAGLDNNVTLANNSTLTIQSRNDIADGAGTINLSNLAFTTSGTGSITVQGGAGAGVGATSSITVGNLTSGSGGTSLSTDNGSVTINGLVSSTGAVVAGASSAINVNNTVTGSSIALNAPTVNLEANLNSATITGTATTVNVNSNAVANGEQIQDGVNVAAAGATVNVGAGTYNETIQISKNLSLIGAGQGLTIIAPTSLGAAPALSNGAPWATQLYTPLVLAQNADNVDISLLTIDGSAVDSGTTAGLTYYNAGGDVNNVTVLNGGAFGAYAVADGTKGHAARTVNFNNVTSFGNSWAALAAIGNNLTVNILGGTYTGTGGSDALDLSNGSKGSITGGTYYAGTHSDKAGISFHGAHDWTITGAAIHGSGTDSTGIADDGTAYGVAAASNISIVGGTISNVGTGIDAVGGSNWDVNGTTITAASAGVGKGIHFNNLVDNSGNTVTGAIISDFATGIHNNGTDGTTISGGTLTNNTTGVLVNPSSGVVVENVTINGGVTGVEVLNSSGARVRGNDITGTQKGIFADNASDIWVYDNDINGATVAGVHLTNTDGSGYGNDADIWYNRIVSGANAVGIWVESSDFVTVGAHFTNQPNADDALNGNTITGGKYGIWVADSNNAMVRYNNVKDQVAGLHNDAITISGGSDVTVQNNLVQRAGWDGITLTGALRAQVLNNTVEQSAASAIVAFGSDDTLIQGNTLNNNWGGTWIGGNTDTTVNNNIVNGTTGNHGIYVWGSETGLEITNNTVNATKLDGIHVEGAPSADISGNHVGYTEAVANTFVAGADGNIGNDGIYLSGSNGAVIKTNTITGATDDGIEIVGSEDVTVGGVDLTQGNKVYRSGHDGITTEYGDNVDVTFNTVTDTLGASAIAIHHTTGSTVEGNVITNANLLGIYGQNSHGIEVLNNEITNVGYGAPLGHPHGNGIGVESANVVTITGNTLNTVRSNGISVGLTINNGVATSTDVTVDNNKVSGTGSDGIVVDGGAISVSGNTVNTTGGDGIDVRNSSGTNAADGVKITNNKVGYLFDGVTTANNNNIAGNGIVATDSDWAQIQSNKVIDAAGNGIYNNSSDHTTIGGAGVLANTITSVGLSGILVNPSFDVDVIGNTIKGANIGVQLDNSSGLLVEENIISDVNEGVQVTSLSGSLDVLGNTISANNAGIWFINALDATTVSIHDNVIAANLDNGTAGSGIEFSGAITNSTIAIGNGSGSSDPSNFITVGPIGDNDTDGIYFGGDVGTGAVIKIDGNRIGYTGTPGVSGSEVAGNLAKDGIEFVSVSGNADIDITDNRIDADVDGIKFSGTVGGTATILIGGWDSGLGAAGYDTNIINALGTGVAFLGHVTDDADVEISYNKIDGDENGVQFSGINGAATVLIDNNDHIVGGDNGILFGAGSPSVEGTATVTVSNNDLIEGDNGIQFADAITGDTLVSITGNTQITGNNGSGILFNGTSNALYPLGTTEQELNIEGNTIKGSAWGINFAGATADLAHDIRIASNTITGLGNDGIRFGGLFSDATAWISGNTISGADDGIAFISNVVNGVINIIDGNTITGANDGIHFEQNVSGASSVVTVSNNTSIKGTSGDGVKITGSLSDGKVHINDNHDIIAGDNGIEFGGTITNATVEVLANNAGITSNNHGIFFGAAIAGADIDIHDNLINADANNSGPGDGIRFDGAVTTSTVNIGDGSGASLNVDASNVISGVDGINFTGEVGTGAQIVIDGNRIGYGGTAAAPTTGANTRVTDDGISFALLADTADIDITGNFIRSNDDGIVFNNNVDDTVNVLIGGLNNGNTVYANNGGNGNGVVFEGTVEDQALVQISYNDISADQDGVLFVGGTSNALLPAGTSEQEILITANTITGGNNGIRFAQSASGELHDIRITNNSVNGDSLNGIQFAGAINDAEIWILGNASIVGDDDGIEFNGSISGQSYITVSYNTVDADGEGVVFRGETSNADLSAPYSQSEILIANNDIEGGLNGIAFYQDAYGFRHDITIRDNVNIRGNNGDGILFEDDIEAATLRILNNGPIWGSRDGIHIEGRFSDDAIIDISGNWDINSGSGDGIEVTETSSTWGAQLNITGNHVHYTGDNGIEVNNVDGAYIYDNYVHDADADGIQVNNSDYAEIIGNEVFDSGDDGIDVDNSDNVDVNGNHVHGADENGIEVTDSFNADIRWNRVHDVDGDGIYADNIDFGDVRNNRVRRTGGDGIQVLDSWGVDVNGNTIRRAGDDGIDVHNSDFADVNGNNIRRTNANGIELTSSDYADIEGNTVDYAGENGIYVNPSSFVDIIGNFVNFADWDGIQVNGGTNNEANSNTVFGSGWNGIAFNGSDNFYLGGNTANNNGLDGILINASNFGSVNSNTTNLNLGDGIEIRNAGSVGLNNNTANNNQVGLRLLNVGTIGASGNGFGFNSLYGMLAEGASNGLITLTNNVFNASPVGARFESGQIDISNLSLPNIFVGTGGTVGMQFDEVGADGSLTLVGRTIGSTIFTGFLPIGSFYVRFEDGTLLDTVTGEPIVIDGLNANFDGLIPASQGGFLTLAQLAFLEDRIFDADDSLLNGRGQLFVGRVPTQEDLGLENLEDFFNRFGTPLDADSGFSVTVRGLPNVTAAGLNALTPAAGEAGPAGLAGIEPAAGEEATGTTSPQDIEPEAGDGASVSCWSDAVSGGGATTFNFGGSFEDSLAGASNCSSGDI